MPASCIWQMQSQKGNLKVARNIVQQTSQGLKCGVIKMSVDLQVTEILISKLPPIKHPEAHNFL